MKDFARITAVSYNLYHCPGLAVLYGTTPAAERKSRPESEYLEKLGGALRTFSRAAAYPPNLTYIGELDPRELPPRPWSDGAEPAEVASPVTGRFGDLLDQGLFFGLLKFCDAFDLVLLEAQFAREIRRRMEALPVFRGADLSALLPGVPIEEIERAVEAGALPLPQGGEAAGCVKPAHPEDVNLNAHTILENLAAKAGAVYAVRRLLALSGTPPEEVDYILETSEEACGDGNQRGGGNFAKAVGESAGLVNATGSDIRAFCAGPVHGLLQAASLVRGGTFRKIVVTAGGTTAKLAMNSKKHMEKGFPLLEDCLGSFAVLVEAAGEGGLVIRNDITGIHRIGSGSAPQNVIQNLVADPLEKGGYRFDEIDYYAPELHDPEVTEAGGAGNVTLSNLKMIAAMAVMKKQITISQMNDFIDRHGSSGWAPTQGHIPSGFPALGWMLKWASEGRLDRGLVIGKGSLFLGRMTGLFDGVSILLENGFTAPTGRDRHAQGESARGASGNGRRIISLGLPIPGSESGVQELYEGAKEAERSFEGLKVVFFGEKESDPLLARKALQEALTGGALDGAVAFHYPFPLGTTTVAPVEAPGTGREFMIASTTGTSAIDRIESLIRNAIAGIAAAKARGILRPKVGFLNLDGAVTAMKGMRQLEENGYPVRLSSSARGDSLLRGNDLLKGTVDVLVCDSLSGNAFVKLLGAWTTAGEVETAGCGYGPALGTEGPVVSIVSRATAAPVITRALVMTAEMVRRDLTGIYRAEMKSARKAGLEEVIAGCVSNLSRGTGERSRNSGETAVDPRDAAGAPKGGIRSLPEKTPVETEIEGIDVFRLQGAVDLLLEEGIYCEAGMGCTGPVILLASGNRERALKFLKNHRFL